MNSFVNYSDVRFLERPLIGEIYVHFFQMAELHGELMEFQENLQRQLVSKESYINRLKRELVSLRGPLPEEMSPFPSSSDRQEDREESKRPLINIWIPSVFEGGKNTDSHHVYQVSLYHT